MTTPGTAAATPQITYNVTFPEAQAHYADIEMHIQMGFKEGFTMTLNELENLLTSAK